MTTYFTDDFADFPADWTERIKAPGTWAVTSGDLSIPGAASGDWNVLSWDDLDADGNRANVEVLGIVTMSGFGRWFTSLRTSGADESTTNYSIYFSSTLLRVYYCAGADTPVVLASATQAHSASSDYWFRFRLNGASPTTVQAKAWTGAIGDEPGTWDIDTTDSTGPQVAGWIGPAMYSANSTTDIKQFGVGTNGDTAPSAAGGGAPAESGGASSTLTVTAAGAGSAAEAASGGASASVSVSAAGTGTAAEQASGGASASVTISAVGAGSALEQASGGASASVVVTAAGAGTASTATSGGASAVVTVSAAGTGTATEAASGGASSAVSVTAAGAGTSSAGASGGSTATVSVSAVGAGTAFQPASGGAGAAVLVTAAGAGLALEIVAGGSSATVTVSAVGGGTDGSIVTGTEYIRLYSRITPAVAALSPICPTVARSSPLATRRDLRSNIDLESPT